MDADLTRLRDWLVSANVPAMLEVVDRRIAGRFISERLNADGLHRKTQQRIVSACRSYWVWMGRKGIVDDVKNPWDRQAPPKALNTALGDSTERQRAFADAEIVTLLNGPADTELADLMRICALSGMRIDEPYRLLVSDCAGGVFNIRRAKTKAGVRRVPIHPDIAAIVARRTADKDPSDFLFPEPGALRAGRERSMAASQRFVRYRRAVGVDDVVAGRKKSFVNFHSFRHWFITTAIRAGEPDHIVKQVVGQKLQGVTLGVYFAGDIPARLRECVEAVRLPDGVVAPRLGVLPGPAKGRPRKPTEGI